MSYLSITVVGTRRRLELVLPETIPVGELTAELAPLLEEPASGPPPAWGLVRMGGGALDDERGLAAQHVASGALLFLRDLASPGPGLAADDPANEVAGVVEGAPGRWTPAGMWSLLVLAAAAWVIAAGVLAWQSMLTGTAEAGGIIVLALAWAGVAAAIGRSLKRPLIGMALAASTLPLWAAAGLVVAEGTGPGMIAAGLATTAVGALGLYAAADEGAAPAAGVAIATLPWAMGLAWCAWLGAGVEVAAAVLAPAAIGGVQLLHQIPELGARMRGALTAGEAATLAVALALLMTAPGGWGRALALTAAAAALLRARRRTEMVEVASLGLAALAPIAALEMSLAGAERAAVVVATGLALAGLGVVARQLRVPGPVRRHLAWMDSAAAIVTVPLALGTLGFFGALAGIV